MTTYFWCFFILSLLFVSKNTEAQEKALLVYDLKANTIDTLPTPDYNPSTKAEKTNFFPGNFDNNIAVVEQIPPTTNVYPNTHFTYKKRVVPHYNPSYYPIRTNVKLFAIKNDTLQDLCSGSMVSSKHVLSAAHCIVNFATNTINQDSVLVCPVYDEGMPNTHFDCSYVTKIYFFKDWNIPGEDIALYTLQNPVGLSTGWISIGFNKEDYTLLNSLFYKFSYPSTTIPNLDSNSYNGDRIYFSFGHVDTISEDRIGITNASGIPGESGSSIIKIINYSTYTTYGTLSLSNNLTHSRIKNWQYYALKGVIKEALAISNSKKEIAEKIIIYPNPTDGEFRIQNKTGSDISKMKLYNSLGQKVMEQHSFNNNSVLNISSLKSGIYYLHLLGSQFTLTKKIVKQ